MKNASCKYRTHQEELIVLCYADDAVLISENEDEFQKLLHQFYLTGMRYNMAISVPKIKFLVIEPIRCKLAVNNEIIGAGHVVQILGSQNILQIGRERCWTRSVKRQEYLDNRNCLEKQTHEKGSQDKNL